MNEDDNQCKSTIKEISNDGDKQTLQKKNSTMDFQLWKCRWRWTIAHIWNSTVKTKITTRWKQQNDTVVDNENFTLKAECWFALRHFSEHVDQRSNNFSAKQPAIQPGMTAVIHEKRRSAFSDEIYNKKLQQGVQRTQPSYEETSHSRKIRSSKADEDWRQCSVFTTV